MFIMNFYGKFKVFSIFSTNCRHKEPDDFYSLMEEPDGVSPGYPGGFIYKKTRPGRGIN
jgi:hypothetical protein